MSLFFEARRGVKQGMVEKSSEIDKKQFAKYRPLVSDVRKDS